MSVFVYGKSVSGGCGDFVIVRKEAMDYLEAEAREARPIIAAAAAAKTVGEMGKHLDKLPPPYSFNWEAAAYEDILHEEIGEDPAPDVLDKIPLTPEIWERFLEWMFTDSSSGARTGQRVFDVTACYGSVRDLACVEPFIRFAQHDPATGFDDIDGAVQALEADGYTCVRDDDRIREIFTFIVTERFLVP